MGLHHPALHLHIKVVNTHTCNWIATKLCQCLHSLSFKATSVWFTITPGCCSVTVKAGAWWQRLTAHSCALQKGSLRVWRPTGGDGAARFSLDASHELHGHTGPVTTVALGDE